MNRAEPISTDPSDPLRFLQVLWSVEHALQAASKRMLARIGVTGPQRFVIRMLGRNPGLAAGEVADRMRIDPSTLTGILQRLQTSGMLKRQTDSEDRRRAVLVLSDEGRKLDMVRDGTIESAIARAMARFNPEQIAVADQVLAALVEELELVAR